jgi:hypothetical protein
MLLAGASVAPQGFTTPGGAPDYIIYEAHAGDTLEALARDYFLDPEGWRLARAENRLPSTRLEEGQRIRLDVGWLRRTPLEAEILAFRGDVRVLRGQTRLTVGKGLRLREGDRLEVGPMAFLTLGLPDGSQAAIPTNSIVEIERLRRYALEGALDRRFRIERGSLESRVEPLRTPSSRYEVTTPLSVAAVRGTDFCVSYTPGLGRSTAEVLEGKVGVEPERGAEALVPADFGLVVTAAGAGRLERLLAPPVALAMPMVQAGAEVRFAVRPEAGAVVWQAELATDSAFNDRVASAASTDGRFAMPGIAPGRYFVRIRAISDSGLLGRPAEFSLDRRQPGSGLAMAGPVGGGDGSDPREDPTGPTELAYGPTPPAAGVAGLQLAEGGGGGGADMSMLPTNGGVEEGDSSEGVEPFLGTQSPEAGPWSALGRFLSSGGGGGAGGGGGGGGAGGGSSAGGPGPDSGPGPDLPEPVMVPDPIVPPGPVVPPVAPGAAVEGEAIIPILPPPAPPPGPDPGPPTEGGVVLLPDPILPAGPPEVPGGGDPFGPGKPGPGEIGGGPAILPLLPVPEPATWLLLVTGFGLLGLAVRRRRPALPGA